jgi:nuclear pore complex protein Nup98-Nup96
MSSSSSPEITARFDSLFRRRALSAWLRDAVAPSIETALRDAPLAPPERTALIYLSGYQISKAANAAADGGLGHLAALITQAGGDDDLRAELRAQLEIWREERADAFVDADTRRIYALLAGLVGILPGSGGPGPERCPDLNVGEGLDWKRAFGLRLWYGIPQDGTVQDVWEAYRTSLDEEPETTAAPKSWYIEGRPSKDTMAPWKYQDSLPDVLYTLIRLFADPSFGLSDALVPLSFGPSPSDVSMSWHLYVLLSRCMQVRDLGDREPPQEYEGEEGDEEETIEGHSPGADLLANSYATQLEGLGMIQEAVFVLLHIEGAHGYVVACVDFVGPIDNCYKQLAVARPSRICLPAMLRSLTTGSHVALWAVLRSQCPGWRRLR